jgi:cobalt/nickel transport protein
MKPIIKNSLLLIVVAILAFGPLIISHNAEFSGADDQAATAIANLNTNYKPWFKPLWKPQSTEVESFLFALQAAIGSGIVFYYIGYSKGKHSITKKDIKNDQH